MISSQTFPIVRAQSSESMSFLQFGFLNIKQVLFSLHILDSGVAEQIQAVIRQDITTAQGSFNCCGLYNRACLPLSEQS